MLCNKWKVIRTRDTSSLLNLFILALGSSALKAAQAVEQPLCLALELESQ